MPNPISAGLNRLHDALTPNDLRNARIVAARERYEEVTLVDDDGHYLISADGRLFTSAGSGLEQSGAHEPGSTLFAVDSTGDDVVWLRPVAPYSVEALRREREREAEASRRATSEQARQLRRDRRPITLAEIDGRTMPTLREAVQRIKARQGQVRCDDDGRLVVEVALSSALDWPTLDACRVVYAAADHVTAAIKSKRPLDQLPDLAVTPTGALVDRRPT